MTDMETLKYIESVIEQIDVDTYTRDDKNQIISCLERFKGISIRDPESYDFIITYKKLDAELTILKKIMKIK